MWTIFAFCFLFRFSSAFSLTNETEPMNSYGKSEVKTGLQNDLGQFLSDIWQSVASDTEYTEGDEAPVMLMPFSQHEEGRSKNFKNKKSQLQFFMKTFMIIKIIMGVLLPMGILAAKIISWKSVTLSLMAFMMAATIFIKSLFTGSYNPSTPTTHYVPPVFIHGSPNDVYWKRQGDIHPTYSWNTS